MDIEKISEPVSKLIDAIKDAIGVLYEPKRIERKAKAEVKAEVYKKVGDLIIDKLDQRALTRWLNQENKRQLNIDNIVKYALLESSHKKGIGSSKLVDEDWLTEFFNLSQDVSNEDLQIIWGKLLANEVDKPGSFQRRTLQTLKLLSNLEAKLFDKFCSNLITVVDDDETNNGMVVQLLEDGSYSDDNWNVTGYDIGILQEVGLVLDYSLILLSDTTYEIIISDVNYKVNIDVETDLELMSLTSVGKEIFSIMNPTENSQFLKETKEHLIKKNIIT